MTESTPIPFPESEGSHPVFQPRSQELEIEFGEQFSKLLGRFVYCADSEELKSQLLSLALHHKWEKIYYQEEALEPMLPGAFFTTAAPEAAPAAGSPVTDAKRAVHTAGAAAGGALPAGQEAPVAGSRITAPLASTHISLAEADAAVTTCEALVARTGSIILSSAQKGGRTTSVYTPVHLCIAFTDQLVYDLRDGLELMKKKYAGKLPSMISFATGPSRTADIEKTLVVGVHGPGEVYVFLVERGSAQP